VTRIPTADDVLAAARRLEGHAVRTPVLRSAALDARAGRPVLLKCETFQHGGAFKFRGAYNRLSQLSAEERDRGVVAYSSGNHAQGVALAARSLGISATIVMPADAPAIKLARTRDYGATVVTYDRFGESREAIAAGIAERQGATLVPPFDDPDIVAGQGTCGVEFVEQARELGMVVETMLTAASGGGLAAGLALALERLSPKTRLYTVEPEHFDDYRRSLEAGERMSNAPGAASMCDALMSPSPGAIPFAINRERLAGGLVVTETEVARAVAYAVLELKLLVEPGGAVALAALLAGKAPGTGPIGLVLSGGNIDPEVLARCLSDFPNPREETPKRPDSR
jgi:threonine dehydratase